MGGGALEQASDLKSFIIVLPLYFNKWNFFVHPFPDLLDFMQISKLPIYSNFLVTN